MEKKKKITIYLSSDELKRIETFSDFSDCKERAEYVRKRVLRMPIKFTYRDRSFDDFIDECIRLRNDLKKVLELPFEPEMARQVAAACEDIKKIIYKLYEQCKHN